MTNAREYLGEVQSRHNQHRAAIETVKSALFGIGHHSVIVLGTEGILQALFTEKWSEAVASARELYGSAETDQALKELDA